MKVQIFIKQEVYVGAPGNRLGTFFTQIVMWIAVCWILDCILIVFAEERVILKCMATHSLGATVVWGEWVQGLYQTLQDKYQLKYRQLQLRQSETIQQH